MKTAFVPYSETRRFSTLILDYLSENKNLKDFYTATPSLENFQRQAQEKKKEFSAESRTILYNTLKEDYKDCPQTDSVKKNIEALQQPNTLTITTGHQLSLMTGPLFFIYKILSAIKLCQQLNQKEDGNHYVPVYWMATEDHDFEEISHFFFGDKKILWNRDYGGPVGRMNLKGMEAVLTVFEKHLGHSKNATWLKALITNSYRNSNTLAAATRKLVNGLFGAYGLVILDGDHPALKKQFIPAIRTELLEQRCEIKVNEQIKKLQKKYNPAFKPQVTPRPINLFYLGHDKRLRIVNRDNGYALDGSEVYFSKAEFLEVLQQSPEYFSPNVLLRPLYQETILPNIGYIGGGGELAYWFQLKAFFKDQNTRFPILLLRNSALLMSRKLAKKQEKLGISNTDLFLKRNTLINKKIRQISNIDLDLSFLKTQLQTQFDHLGTLIHHTDRSFKGAVEAQKVKQFKGIDHLEKRLLKAQKRKLQDHVVRLHAFHMEIFPDDGLQERHDNIVPFLLDTGPQLLSDLISGFDPLSKYFTIGVY